MEATISAYKMAIDLCSDFELKGKSMMYTSANGYMFSTINKAGELGIRFSNEAQEKYIKELKSDFFYSHGAKMKGYVLIPASAIGDERSLAKYLQESYEYVMSLKPK